jgi:hypothetical protein
MSLFELYLIGIKDMMGMLKSDWKQIILTEDIILYGMSTRRYLQGLQQLSLIT